MTPEKLIDYTVKFGVLPLAIAVIFWTRSDLEETKQDVKQIQQLLTDCYKDQIRTLQPSKVLTSDAFETVKLIAVLTDKQRLICYD